MTNELNEAPIEATRIIEPPPKPSWREKRERRRRRRVWFEEILGWVLVPAIIVGCYWSLKAGLAAMGSSPEALMEGFRTLTDAL
ncbi:hypothetical protein [Microvirga sp. TS319]|uniref:hypothetical protein n=1 Tax=Microvirga sp. TS319 TaxID=3241165 RepID=UPI00351A2BDF